MEENNITKNKPKRKYKKRKKRLMRRETKEMLIGFVKQLIIGIIVVAIVVSFTVLIMVNKNLREDKAEVDNMYHSYKGMYEEADSEFTTEFNYWTEKYQVLRTDYMELFKYVGEEDLNYEVYTVTGYSADDKKQGTSSTTSIGFNLKAQYMDYINICAVDESLIPYGSIVLIKANWAGDGYIYEKAFIAGDCGGDIIGQRIDVYFSSKKQADDFGIQGCPVKVIAKEEK